VVYSISKIFATTLVGHIGPGYSGRFAPPAHPLHTRITNIFGTAISETTMRPDPRSASPSGTSCSTPSRRPA
jgi:hypothetical protein